MSILWLWVWEGRHVWQHDKRMILNPSGASGSYPLFYQIVNGLANGIPSNDPSSGAVGVCRKPFDKPKPVATHKTLIKSPLPTVACNDWLGSWRWIGIWERSLFRWHVGSFGFFHPRIPANPRESSRIESHEFADSQIRKFASSPLPNKS